MHANLGWQEIAIRLVWTVIAGGLIGMNREERGRAAGLRTTLLVCLAASFSMLQMNLLQNTTGKESDSFVVMDLMRLPLGILTGMGFIGAGAIVRRENLVIGVTTAATLWFVTVMGLCFGGGQIGLGIAALALGFLTLSGLKWTEKFCRQERIATLVLEVGPKALTEAEIAQTFAAEGYQVKFTSTSLGEHGRLHELHAEVRWHGRRDANLPVFLAQVAQRFSLLKLDCTKIAGH